MSEYCNRDISSLCKHHHTPRYARDASRTKANKAKEFLKTVTEHNPEDADAWVELAALYERTPTDKKDAEVSMYVYQWVEVNGYLASNVMFNMGDLSIHCVFSDYA